MSHNRERGLAMALVALAAGGCANVEIYDAKGADTGIKFYTAKPYVLMPKDGGEAKVVYLPDLERPLYAKPRAGIGMFKYTISLNEGGMLTSLNQESDPKLPELLNSVASLNKAFRTDNVPPPRAFGLYEVIMKDGVTILKEVGPEKK
jgi:hypothetical protein